MFEQCVARYLNTVDRVLPGFVELLYVTGSAALDAWQAGRSDIDTMIVTSRTATDDDLSVLAEVHAAMPTDPHLDGVYLDRATFLTQPADQRIVPFVVNGIFHTDRPCGDLNPVLWLVLRRYGLPVRGPAVADLGVVDEAAVGEALRRYNLDNLRTYWQPLAAEIRKQEADGPVDGETIAWVMLGPARLHYTLAHGDIVPKPASAAYLAGRFPAWATLADRAARWRAGEDVSFTATDLSEAARSIDAIAEDAWQRFGQST